MPAAYEQQGDEIFPYSPSILRIKAHDLSDILEGGQPKQEMSCACEITKSTPYNDGCFGSLNECNAKAGNEWHAWTAYPGERTSHSCLAIVGILQEALCSRPIKRHQWTMEEEEG